MSTMMPEILVTFLWGPTLHVWTQRHKHIYYFKFECAVLLFQFLIALLVYVIYYLPLLLNVIIYTAFPI